MKQKSTSTGIKVNTDVLILTSYWLPELVGLIIYYFRYLSIFQYCDELYKSLYLIIIVSLYFVHAYIV